MTEKKLRSGVHADVKNICKDLEKELSIEFKQDAIDVISELIWKKLSLYSQDLEAFHKHAKRSTITTDDVKLLCRRNISLKEFIEREYPTVVSKGESSSNARKRKAIIPTVFDD